MVKLKIFEMKKLKELIAENKDSIMKAFRENLLSKIDIITRVVDSSTIRAYRGNKKYKPLSIYRAWAWEVLNDNNYIGELITNNNFKNLHDLTFSSFKEFWDFLEPENKIPPYKTNKIIDLFFKGISQYKKLLPERREWFFNNAHVPVDKYTLEYLRDYTNRFKIGKNPSMGDLDKKLNYSEIQEEIRNLCGEESPYLFEALAQMEGRQVSGPFVPIKKKDK